MHAPRHDTDNVETNAPYAGWLLSKKKVVNKAKDAKYNDTRGAKKKYAAAQDTYSVAMTWLPTDNKSIRKIVDRHTYLVCTCHIINGHRVTVPHNFRACGRRITNSQKGKIVAHDNETLLVRFDNAPTQDVVVHHVSSLGSVEYDCRMLKRCQFPLEHAAATTIHRVQGGTPHMAKYTDGEMIRFLG